MTKRLTTETAEPLDELTQQEITAYETIAQALENLGDSEAVIRISRRGKSGGLEFCEQIPVDPAFSPQYIKESWGGGIYSVQFYGPKPGETGNKYLKQVTLRVAGAPREKKEDAEGPARGSASGDPAVIALQLELATLKGMLAGLTQAKGAEGGSPLDNLEKLTTVIRNITPPAPSGGMGAAEVFGIVRDVMSLSKEMAPESSEGTPWGLIVEKAVEPAIGLIGQALAAQKAGQEPAPVVALNAPPAPAALAPGAPMWQAELAKIVPRLLKRAREGKDPELAAAIFLEDAPGGVVAQLEELAKDSQFVMTTVALAEQYFPEVREVRGWVEMFVKAVQVELTEPEDTGPVLVPEKPKKKKGGDDASAG